MCLLSSPIPPEDFTFTKRNFLRKIARLFDPIGLLAPFTIRAKILLQEIWTMGLGWDDLIDEELVNKARRWFKELSELNDVKVPRRLRLKGEESVVEIKLHIFADASQEAYGAVVYSRCVYKSGLVSRRLVTAKTRVAPLKTVSIPRLELMAAVLGLQLARSVSNVLGLPLRQAVFWSGSMDVLWWVRGHCRSFKPFVGNRIGEIQTETNPD